MLEFRLRSGHVVAFDGRILEVFADGGPSRRLHIGQLRAPESVAEADGGRTLPLADGTVTLSFARDEAPTCARLVAAIEAARAALARLQ